MSCKVSRKLKDTPRGDAKIELEEHGSIAVIFTTLLEMQELNVEIHEDLKLEFSKFCNLTSGSVLLCVCYIPQWQEGRPIIFIQESSGVHRFSQKWGPNLLKILLGGGGGVGVFGRVG